jgi:hypothetical protein
MEDLLMKQGVTEAPLVKKDAATPSTPTKYTYFFGGGKAEGNGKMRTRWAARVLAWPR